MTYTAFDDPTLIALIARAEDGALDELYRRYSRLVYALALNIVTERAAAEEVTLDVFARVWDKADTYRPGQAKVSTWLTTMARNRAIDRVRRRQVRVDYSSISWAEVDPTQRPEAPQNVERAVELSLRQERVRWAVAQLPPGEQKAVALAYFGGYSHRQIAETLDEPLGTVKTRIRSAMKKLRKLLDQAESKSG